MRLQQMQGSRMPKLPSEHTAIPDTNNRSADPAQNDLQNDLDAVLSEMIDDLRDAEQKSFGDHHRRTDFYRYLTDVYDTDVYWKGRKNSKQRARRVAALIGRKVRKNTHPLLILIDATSTQSAQVRTRWVQALRFAARRGVKPEDLSSFFNNNNGVSGCARKMSALMRE